MRYKVTMIEREASQMDANGEYTKQRLEAVWDSDLESLEDFQAEYRDTYLFLGMVGSNVANKQTNYR